MLNNCIQYAFCFLISEIIIMKEINISRRAYTKDQLESLFEIEGKSSDSIPSIIRSNIYCSKKRAWKLLTSFLPIIKIVSNYKREYIFGDILAGLTVSFLHLPQCLAFSMLAGLPAVYGLYTTFFPLLFYLLFGTSPYVAFATNAVIALLVQKIVLSEAEIFTSSHSKAVVNITTTTEAFISNMSLTGNLPSAVDEADVIDIKVSTAMAASLIMGLILTALGILRLGFLMTYMSESFIGGFTTAAGIHIVSSQVPKMFGIKVSVHTGAGKLVKMYIELFSNINKTVVSDIIITAISISVLLLVKICINERFKERLKMPIPIDLIVVIAATMISHFGKLESNVGISVIGNIPSGFRYPAIPNLECAPRIIVDCFIMAVLTLMLTISLAKLTAKIHDQRIDDNQEMVAYGITNILSSFFSCFPQSATPSRTMLDSDLGANTTLNSIPTIVFMLLVILWIGQLFQSLPMSVLAAMIAVAMKNLILQFGDLPKIWRINKLDFCIWIISCFVSVFVNLDYGIIAGIGFSIVSVIIQHQMTSGVLIGKAGIEDVFLGCENRKNVNDFENIKIFQFPAPLYYANAELFKSQLNRKVVDPMKLMRMKKNKPNDMEIADDTIKEINNGLSDDLDNGKGDTKLVKNTIQYIILDCQMISHIDLSGISILSQIIKEYKLVYIDILMVKCSPCFIKTLTSADFFEHFPSDFVFYDITDALHFINKEKEESSL